MRFLQLVVFVDMIAMAIENESKNEDLDLYSVSHNDRDKGGTVKREEARLGSENLGLWCYYTKNLLRRLDQERTCLLNAGKDGGKTHRHSTIGQTVLCLHLPSPLLPLSIACC